MMKDHRKIFEQYYKIKIPEGYHIHHKDMNHANNDPINLEMLTPDEHAQKHGFLNNFIMAQTTASQRGAMGHKRPECRERMRVAMKGNKNAAGTIHTEEQNRLHANRAKVFMKGKQNSLGYRFPESYKQKKSIEMIGNQYGIGYRHTESAKKRIGVGAAIAMKGNKNSLGSKRTDKWRQEQSERVRLWHQSRRGLTIAS
jgi:hypothetical protein